MWYARNNKLYITRGDSAYIDLGLTTGDGKTVPKTPYELKDGESIHIQVRKGAKSDGELVFTGQIEPMPDGSLVWHIYTENTKNLEIGEDIYWYDAELRTGDDVFTFIKSKPFIVMDETTKED